MSNYEPRADQATVEAEAHHFLNLAFIGAIAEPMSPESETVASADFGDLESDEEIDLYADLYDGEPDRDYDWGLEADLAADRYENGIYN